MSIVKDFAGFGGFGGFGGFAGAYRSVATGPRFA
jgi:hypothetical protein